MKFTDNNNNEVTEYIPIVTASDQPKALLGSITEIKMLEEQFDLHGNLKSKFVAQSFGQCLQGQYAKKYCPIFANINFSEHVNQAGNNCIKWKNLIADFCKSCFPRGALEDQKDSVEET